MKLALDTNAYTDLAKGIPQVTSLVAMASDVFLPFVVMADSFWFCRWLPRDGQ
jgi:hypothetical protein